MAKQAAVEIGPKAIAIEVNGKPIFRPGTIIGKALQSFNGERGTMEMFAFSS